MINGAHFLLHSTDSEADRKFFRDVLGFRSVDVGHGWLIFALPPTEMAVHPSDGDLAQDHADHKKAWVLYLMCDDLQAEIKSLKAKKVRCTEIQEERWGIITTIPLPSGAEIGLYQPKHKTAIGLGSK
jgi:predicted enzyme related to lactoylglutathione lyase